MGWRSCFQVLTNNKFIGYLLTIGIIMSWMVLGYAATSTTICHLRQRARPAVFDMNGYGHFSPAGPGSTATGTLFTLAALLRAGRRVLGARHADSLRKRLALGDVSASRAAPGRCSRCVVVALRRRRLDSYYNTTC